MILPLHSKILCLSLTHHWKKTKNFLHIEKIQHTCIKEQGQYSHFLLKVLKKWFFSFLCTSISYSWNFNTHLNSAETYSHYPLKYKLEELEGTNCWILTWHEMHFRTGLALEIPRHWWCKKINRNEETIWDTEKKKNSLCLPREDGFPFFQIFWSSASY